MALTPKPTVPLQDGEDHKEYDYDYKYEVNDLTDDANDPDAVSFGKWGAGLFDCLDSLMPNCAMASCCTWMTMAQIATRIGMLTYPKALLVFGIPFCMALVLYSGTIVYMYKGIHHPWVGKCPFGFGSSDDPKTDWSKVNFSMYNITIPDHPKGHDPFGFDRPDFDWAHFNMSEFIINLTTGQEVYTPYMTPKATSLPPPTTLPTTPPSNVNAHAMEPLGNHTVRALQSDPYGFDKVNWTEILHVNMTELVNKSNSHDPFGFGKHDGNNSAINANIAEMPKLPPGVNLTALQNMSPEEINKYMNKYSHSHIKRQLTFQRFCAYCVLVGPVYFWLMLLFLRNSVRRRFKIKGDCCGDCCITLLCQSCAAAQMASHVKSYTPHSCSLDQPNVLSSYQV